MGAGCGVKPPGVGGHAGWCCGSNGGDPPPHPHPPPLAPRCCALAGTTCTGRSARRAGPAAGTPTCACRAARWVARGRGGGGCARRFGVLVVDGTLRPGVPSHSHCMLPRRPAGPLLQHHAVSPALMPCHASLIMPRPPQVHWFSIMNSMLIVMVMATLVAMILIRCAPAAHQLPTSRAGWPRCPALPCPALPCTALHSPAQPPRPPNAKQSTVRPPPSPRIHPHPSTARAPLQDCAPRPGAL